ncbi:MAG: hypothetical protein NT154_04095 [Verrucomicrobia bacterium]|nr:hypothetical protein [Verrucomicrobiota bacterium]
MVLYPTSELSKAAAKVLKKELKMALTADLAQFLNREFAQSVGQFAEARHLQALVGQYYQNKSSLLLKQAGSETE